MNDKALVALIDKHLKNFEGRHKMTTAALLAGVKLHDKEPGSDGAIDSAEPAMAAWLALRQVREVLAAR